MHVSRRRTLKIAGWLSAGAALPACRTKPTMSLYTWGAYSSETLLRAFERAAGVTVQLDTFTSEQQQLARLALRPAFHVSVAIDYTLSSLQREGLIQPLPALQGLQHLAPEHPVWHARAERGGLPHGVPYLWGTTGIGYDSEKVPEVTSWTELFNPKWSGHIAVLDNKGDVMDQALLAEGLDINSTDKDALRTRVFPRLEAQRALLRGYDPDPALGLARGDLWIAQIDSGDLLTAAKRRPSLKYAIPTEGAALWRDYLVIPKACPDVGLAATFIEFLLEPAHAATLANELLFATPNQTALQQGLIERANDPTIYPPADLRARLQDSENWFGNTGAMVDNFWLSFHGAR